MLINILLSLVVLASALALTFPLIERGLFEGAKPFNLQTLYAKLSYITLNALAFASIALGVAEAFINGHVGSKALVLAFSAYALVFGVLFLLRTNPSELAKLGTLGKDRPTKREWWGLYAKLDGILIATVVLNAVLLLSAIQLLK